MSEIKLIQYPNQIPTIRQLALGDIVINYYDGKAYIKKLQGNVQSVVEIGGGAAVSASYATTASYALNGGVTQLVAGTNISLSPVDGRGIVTINASTGGGGSGVPNGPNYSLQYNNGGNFSGSGNFTLLSNNALYLTGSFNVSGSTFFTGSVSSLNGFTGSLFGTSSWAISSSQAISSSYAVTASYAPTASYALNASDILVYVKNQSGNDILKGMVVRITGSNNSSDIPRITTASYENDNNSANTLGIANENILNGNDGFVMTEGRLLGIDTTNYISGQLIYLGPTGSITGSAPLAPLHSVRLGEVIRHQTNNGSIYVRIDNGYELGELHDVRDTTTTGSYGDLLTKSGSIWVTSKTLTGSYSITGSLSAISFTGSFSGSGIIISSSHAISSSYSISSSYALNSLFASTASYVVTAQTASYVNLAQTASYVVNAISASYVLNAISASFSSTASFVTLSQTASYVLNAVSSSFAQTASFARNAQTASYVLNAVSSSFASTSSYVNNLNQAVTIGNITSTPAAENTLNVYPPFAGGTGEGGQILLAASGGLYSSASMLDNWQDQFRILRGSNTGGSNAGLVYVNLQTGNTQFVGAVTASSYSGLPNSHLYVTRNTNQTIPSGNWANQDIVFNNVVVTNGIPYNPAAGTATLTGGKVYRITARLAWSSLGIYLLQFSCYDAGNIQLGPTVEIVQSTNTSNNISDGTLDFIYAPVSNTDVKIRTTGATNALSGEYIRGDLNTQLIIQQLA